MAKQWCAVGLGECAGESEAAGGLFDLLPTRPVTTFSSSVNLFLFDSTVGDMILADPHFPWTL